MERGVTERQIQRLLKKYEAELEGKFERKGQNGTWLTDEACEILVSKMKTNPTVVGDMEQYRENQQLKAEKEELLMENQRLHEAMENLNKKLVAALEQQVAQAKQIAEADTKQLLLEERTEELAALKEERAELKTELDSFKAVGLGFYRKKS